MKKRYYLNTEDVLNELLLRTNIDYHPSIINNISRLNKNIGIFKDNAFLYSDNCICFLTENLQQESYLLINEFLMSDDFSSPVDGECIYDDYILRFKNGYLDGGDLPAVESSSFHMIFMEKGVINRSHKPAVVKQTFDSFNNQIILNEFWSKGFFKNRNITE